MIIPKTLKIGGHIYKVILDKESEAGTSRGNNCGQVNRRTGIISINSSLIQSEQEVTLIHEILHEINNELHETMVGSLSEQLYQVLKDNKMLR